MCIRDRLRPVVVAVGHQRLAERQVEVHRLVGVGPGHRAADQPAPDGVLPAAALGHGELHGVGRRAEHAPLVHGLVGAGAVQLDRPVGGQHQQRHPGVVRLQHGGVQVGHGRARGADHGGEPGPAGVGAARGVLGQALGQAEGQEAGAALVHPHVQGEPLPHGRLVQRERQRGVARAGAEHHVPHVVADEFVNDDPGLRRGGIHHPSPS